MTNEDVDYLELFGEFRYEIYREHSESIVYQI